MLKRFQIIFCFLFFVFCLKGQTNLVPNPSFEQYTQCPDGASELNYATNWVVPTTGTPDYFNSCFDSSMSWTAVMDVPLNILGYQSASEGSGYAGLFAYHIYSQTFREYIQAPLTMTLTASTKYFVTLYVSLADSSRFAVDDFGAYLSVGAITRSDFDAFGYVPQIENVQGNFLSNTNVWYKISGSFFAQGGENYITIGNFKNDNGTDTLRLLPPASPGSDFDASYYYIDNICVSTDSLLCNSFNGISSFLFEEISFYYSVGGINIGGNHDNMNIEIYNASGQLITQQKVNREETRIILPTDLCDGIYIIKTDIPYKKPSKLLILKN